MSKVANKTYAVCASCLHFTHEIVGRQGSYTIHHGFYHRFRDVLFDFSCSCPAYQYRKGKDRYCKHIKLLQKEGTFCGWDQCVEGGSPIDNKCPKCGGPIETLPMY